LNEFEALFEKPHRRYNPLTGEYVLVSPQRANRPWQGKVERLPDENRPSFDPGCYLCPGNPRAGGAVNPDYTDVYVFTNDFPALLDVPTVSPPLAGALMRAEPARGTNRVLCYSPRHNLPLSVMEPAGLEKVIGCWIGQYEALGAAHRWVQVFQNQGEMMGASNPHPHGQVWAVDALPNEALKEDLHQRAYLQETGRSLLPDYLDAELQSRARLVLENERWMVVVPFWAVWPFETMVLPTRPVPRMPDLLKDEISALAVILKALLMGYDRLFEVPFPYSMGWHGAPFDPGGQTHWQLHAHFYPPLLRSATVRKFMVGYEMLAEAQRDLTPEQAAAALRRVMD
jgi:UDPglucose--hexose-1-phosphate uridylyltransferase